MNIIDISQPSQCRDIECREVVYWRVEPKSKKRNPYNAPEPCPKCDGEGGFTNVAADLWAQCSRCDGMGQIQISHFATCIAAAKFRQGRRPFESA